MLNIGLVNFLTIFFCQIFSFYINCETISTLRSSSVFSLTEDSENLKCSADEETRKFKVKRGHFEICESLLQ